MTEQAKMVRVWEVRNRAELDQLFTKASKFQRDLFSVGDRARIHSDLTEWVLQDDGMTWLEDVSRRPFLQRLVLDDGSVQKPAGEGAEWVVLRKLADAAIRAKHWIDGGDPNYPELSKELETVLADADALLRPEKPVDGIAETPKDEGCRPKNWAEHITWGDLTSGIKNGDIATQPKEVTRDQAEAEVREDAVVRDFGKRLSDLEHTVRSGAMVDASLADAQEKRIQLALERLDRLEKRDSDFMARIENRLSGDLKYSTQVQLGNVDRFMAIEERLAKNEKRDNEFWDSAARRLTALEEGLGKLEKQFGKRLEDLGTALAESPRLDSQAWTTHVKDVEDLGLQANALAVTLGNLEQNVDAHSKQVEDRLSRLETPFETRLTPAASPESNAPLARYAQDNLNLTSSLNQALEILGECEGAGYNLTCPVCHMKPVIGHAEGCKLFAVLKEHGKR